MGRGTRPAKAKVEARPTVTRKSRKVDSSTGLQLKQRLAEALEQHAAISEILQVISASPSDVQPVLDTVAKSAARLCGTSDAEIFRRDGDRLRLVAHHGLFPSGPVGEFTVPLVHGTVNGRAMIGGKTVHIADLQTEANEFPEGSELARQQGSRTMLCVPMLRNCVAIGTISVRRTAVELFTERQVALLQTFADQAVIAIENVRLFNETKEALEQQRATAEILRAISSSQTDLQAVFDTIARNAVRLCATKFCAVFRFDGQTVHFVAHNNLPPDGVREMRSRFPMRPISQSPAGRAILTKAVVHLRDALLDSDYARRFAEIIGWREVLAVPMLREGIPVGVIVVAWAESGSMQRGHEELLGTFAEQAVIAIENVRLFNETTEALKQQTAMSEILRVISQSPTDVQPVFDAIVHSCHRLFSDSRVGLTLLQGSELFTLARAGREAPGELKEVVLPWPFDRDSAAGCCILDARLIAIEDMAAAADVFPRMLQLGIAMGFGSGLFVPLLRDAKAIGSLNILRVSKGEFDAKEVSLAQTFADQAVIAIENVRLFKELEARTAQLTHSVGELKALGEVGQAVSSTLDLETVLATIVVRATQLAGMDGGSIWEYDETREQFYLHATDRLPDELVEVLRATPIRKGEGALGRLAVTGKPVEIRDIVDERSYQSRVRGILIRCGYRSVLAVPLLREDHLLGALAVNRSSPGEFAPEVIDLLKTFATQSALAIQNARLFREIEEKSRELGSASRHKSEFLANMSHELRTPLNAIIGFSEVLAERMFGEINDKQAEYLSDILESGRHLLSLINDILDLSKIEAGRMELEPTDFDLPTAIENTLILVRERAHRCGITLGRTVDERLGMIRADERKVKQVLLNLLSNALKFTPERGRIDVQAVVRDGAIEIAVSDTGVGIAPEDQAAVFEEFRQVGAAAKKIEGTGLGLAISRKFIELHRGKIWVRSEMGAGSTFTFTLPLTLDQRHHTG